MSKPAWTEEMNEFLRKNICLLSAQQIGDDPLINKSRNAVVGQVYRLRAKGELPPKEEATTFKKPINLHVRGSMKYAKNKVEYSYSGAILLKDIQHGQCRYSQDQGQDMRCCGKKVLDKYPYCEEHCHIVYKDFDRKKNNG